MSEEQDGPASDSNAGIGRLLRRISADHKYSLGCRAEYYLEPNVKKWVKFPNGAEVVEIIDHDTREVFMMIIGKLDESDYLKSRGFGKKMVAGTVSAIAMAFFLFAPTHAAATSFYKFEDTVEIADVTLNSLPLPTVLSLTVAGLDLTVEVTVAAGQTPSFPLDLFIAAGPGGSVTGPLVAPEPGTAAMMALGLIGLAASGKRRKLQ